MRGFIVTVGLSLVSLALSDPLACNGQACMVENDQAAMLQSSLLHKGEALDAIAGEGKESGGQFCEEARDYGCYRKTGLPACCTDGRRMTCGKRKPPCDKKRKKKGKGKGKGSSSRRRSGRSSSPRWGREIDHTYCSGSYDGQDSRRAAKSACKRDEACGGIYQPGNNPEKWFLCKGFDTFASTSNSVVIKKLGGSSPTQTPPEVTVQTITAGRSSTYKVQLSKLGNPTLWDMKHYLKYDLKAYISDNYSWLDWQHKPLYWPPPPDIRDLQLEEKNKEVHAGEWYFIANK
jgi:hypothetical protein